MDVREKLVELLKTNACQSPFMCDPACRYYGYGDCFPDRFADHLIAHGVTVQECGEWVYDHWCEFKCSVCGWFSNSKPYKGKEKYCPNCGAKMVPKPPKGE